MCCWCFFFFFKQKTAYEMRISDWSSDVCSSDLFAGRLPGGCGNGVAGNGAGCSPPTALSFRPGIGNRRERRAMSETGTTQNMAVFCDFENVALGVKDAKYAAFDIARVLERLLLKGDIVVKKAYCDWASYKAFKEIGRESGRER